jgi:hypothetical protein
VGAATAATPASKKQQAQTMPIGGVKMNDLEKTGKPAGSPFAKKSNKTNKVFLYGGLALGLVIIILIGYAISQIGGSSQP